VLGRILSPKRQYITGHCRWFIRKEFRDFTSHQMFLWSIEGERDEWGMQHARRREIHVGFWCEIPKVGNRAYLGT